MTARFVAAGVMTATAQLPGLVVTRPSTQTMTPHIVAATSLFLLASNGSVESDVLGTILVLFRAKGWVGSRFGKRQTKTRQTADEYMCV